MLNFFSEPQRTFHLQEKHKKLILNLILILLISSLGIFVLGVAKAQAWGLPSGEDILQWILIGIGILLSKVFELTGQILNLVAGLIDGVLAFTSFTKEPIVTIGWTIVRDLANMFFVLILLAIAFATILRIETYGMKALLPKLVIAALLINFSLILAAPIIDFSQILAQFFVKESGGEEFSVRIAAALNLTKISPYKAQVCSGGWGNCRQPAYSQCSEACAAKPGAGPICLETCQNTYCQCQRWTTTDTEHDWGGGATDTAAIVIGLAMAIVFSIIAIFAFMALVLFLIVRIIILWFLLILAPAAWLLWILPATRGHFSRWWSTFLKWAFFAPIYLFFLYLALRAFPAFLSEGVVSALGTGAEPSDLLPKLFEPRYALQFFLVLGILLGGLIMAQQMGIYGARGVIGLAKGMGRRASGVAATQRWWKARVTAREEEAKERRKVSMRLREAGGLRQIVKERFRPTVRGRAEARARRNRVITEEATRMGNAMDRPTVLKIAGKRGPLPKGARMQKLAAQVLLASPGINAYKKMMRRTPPLPPTGTRPYRKIKKLTNRVYQDLARKITRGKLVRYRMTKEE